MSIFKVEYAPPNPDDLGNLIQEVGPFLIEMWTPDLEKIHGALEFNVEGWISLWMPKHGFFITARNDTTKALEGILMAIKFTPMWYRRMRVEIIQMSSKDPKIETALLKYLIDIAPIMGVDEIYQTHYVGSSERKDLIYGGS